MGPDISRKVNKRQKKLKEVRGKQCRAGRRRKQSERTRYKSIT